jgi:hypothetical protein
MSIDSSLVHTDLDRITANTTPVYRLNYLRKAIKDLDQNELTDLLKIACVSMEQTIGYDLHDDPYIYTVDMIKLILQSGADPTINNSQPFVTSCRFGDVGLAMLFLELGADLNAQDGRALAVATKYERCYDLVKFLLESGATVTENAIVLSIEQIIWEDPAKPNMRLLLDHGVNPNLILSILMTRYINLGDFKRIISILNPFEPDYFKVFGEMMSSEQTVA